MIRTPGADRIQTPHERREDEVDASLRPRALEEFVGQEAVKDQLGVSIAAAAARGEALDHVLLAGPPGLGKTSLAQIVARELDVPFIQTAGPALERKADIASFLTALEPRAVFFVDEIHRLPRAVEETFYPAMEDRQLPITVGAGAGARVVTLDLPAFTLIGATTRAGLLTTPLRDRFGIQHRLDHYDADDLARIVTRSARVLDVEIDVGRRPRDRRARPRHPARGQPAAAAGARLRRGPRQRGDRRNRGRRRARPARGRPRRASTGSTARSSRPSASSSPAARSGSRRSPWRSRRRPTRSRTSTSPTCSSAASSNGPRAAAARRCTRSGISASSRRPKTRHCSDRAFTRAGLGFSVVAHLFICPNCGQRTTATDRQQGFRNQPRGCSKCGFGFLFELLDDYYPAPNAAFFVCDQNGRIIGCGRGSRELTGLSDEKVMGREVREVLGLNFEGGADHVATVLEWGVRQLGKAVVVNAEGDLPAKAVADLFPAYDDDGGLLLVLTPSK